MIRCSARSYPGRAAAHTPPPAMSVMPAMRNIVSARVNTQMLRIVRLNRWTNLRMVALLSDQWAASTTTFLRHCFILAAGELCPRGRPASANRRASTVSHVICLCHGHCSYLISSHSKYTAWCPLPEASDVDRRSYVDWGFRCRLRPSRLDIGKTQARRKKSPWRLKHQ